MRKIKYLLLGGALAGVIGIFTFGQVYPGIDPSVWNAYAGATGVCAAPACAPVIWSKLVSLGVAPTKISLLAVGLLAFAVFEIFWQLLTILSCPQKENVNWWRLTVPLLSMLACVLSVFSEPVWRLSRSGSPALLTLALCALAYELFLVSYFTVIGYDYDGNPIGAIRQNIGRCAAALLLGLLIVETPAAFVLPVLFVLAREMIARRIADKSFDNHPYDLLAFVPQRVSPMITYALLFVGIAVAFAASGMLTNGGLILRRLTGTLHDVLGAATPLGWILWTGCALVPFALNCLWSADLLGKTGRLRFGKGLVIFLSGGVALATVSPLMRGDWALFPSAAVHSPFMQALGAVLAALAAAQALAVFVYFACHVKLGNYETRQQLVFGVSLMLVAALGVVGGGLRRGRAMQVRQAIADAIDETVREAKGLSWIFTDGSVDVGIGVGTRLRHHNLRVVPLVTGGPFSASGSALPQLSDWVKTDSPNLQASAVQSGFDLWVRAGKQPPKASGMLARENWSANSCEYGIVFAERLSERMLGLVRDGALAGECDPSVRFAFSAVLRQLSRMARQRGDAARADELDLAYGVLRKPAGDAGVERAPDVSEIKDTPQKIEAAERK